MPYPVDLQQKVERHLAGLSFGSDPSTSGLEDAMRYTLLAGGKRVRPVLTLATAKAIERDPEWVLPLAGAIEMIHTYSLIHDDLPAMDNDDMRRGKPTCHRKFGENVAILAGDGLYAEAFVQLLTNQEGSPKSVLSCVQELATATGIKGMVGGQYSDVAETSDPGPNGLRHLHALKTGQLIRASVECVLLLAEVEQHTCMEYRRYAEELGVLFQIIDDILDVIGSDEELGKAQGSDERLGKRTYVSEFGLEQAKHLARDSYTNAKDALSLASEGKGSDLEQITDYIFTRTA